MLRFLRLHLPYGVWREVRRLHAHRYTTTACGGQIACRDCGHHIQVDNVPALWSMNGQLHIALWGPVWWDPEQAPVVDR